MSDQLDAPAVSRAVIAPVAAALAVCLVLLALSWPTLVARPRQVPVAITGQPQLVQQARAAVGRQAADAVRLVRVDDRTAAVAAVRSRDAVGAIVLDPTHPEVLTAAAAGPAAQQVMAQLLAALQQQSRAITFRVTDVVPYSTGDPTGNRLTTAALPLALGGVLGGVLLTTFLPTNLATFLATFLAGAGRRRALMPAALLGYGLLAGFGLAAILGPWYGALPGSYLISALAIALVVGAVAAVVAGLRRLIGLPGFAVSALLFILAAMPISGATVPREFLPQFWGDVGQLLPQGAGTTLLRNLSYFPDAVTPTEWLVPAGWAVLGLLLTWCPGAELPQPSRPRIVTASAASPAIVKKLITRVSRRRQTDSRAIVRGRPESKPRESIATDNRVARRTVATRTVVRLPTITGAAASGLRLISPRVRRAAYDWRRSPTTSGAIRIAASDPTAIRGPACQWVINASASAVGSSRANNTMPGIASTSSLSATIPAEPRLPVVINNGPIDSRVRPG